MERKEEVRVKSKVYRQYNLGPWLGGLKDLLIRVLPYISMVNFVLIGVTAYHTTLGPFFEVHLPWMSIWAFMGGILFMVILLMVIEYKVILPSYFTFFNKQQYEHKNPIRGDLEEIKKEIKRLEDKIDERD